MICGHCGHEYVTQPIGWMVQHGKGEAGACPRCGWITIRTTIPRQETTFGPPPARPKDGQR